MKNFPMPLIVFIFLMAICLGWYMYYGMTTLTQASTPDTLSGSVVTDTACSWFECEIDHNLAIQKKLLLSKYELMISQKELEATLEKTRQNIDMNDSAIQTIQSTFNDKFKSAYYSGVNAFH